MVARRDDRWLNSYIEESLESVLCGYHHTYKSVQLPQWEKHRLSSKRRQSQPTFKHVIYDMLHSLWHFPLHFIALYERSIKHYSNKS